MAQAHAGLRSFWKNLGSQGGHEAAELDAWLAGDRPVAVIVGPVGVRRQRVAAWARAVRSRGASEVDFVPMSTLLGTATVRDVLTLSFGLLPSSETAAFSIPRSCSELRAAMALTLQGVDWVSSLPTEEDPLFLWVLEGVDNLADGTLTDLFDPDQLGDGARVLLAVTNDEHEVLEFFGDDVAVLRMPPTTPSQAGQSSAARDLLGSALAPLSAADFAALNVPVPEGDLLIECVEGNWRLATEDARAEHARDHINIEHKIVEVGLGGSPRQRCAPYLVSYLGAHLTRTQGTLEQWMKLVSPERLVCWQTQPHWLVGFLSDVEQCFAAACRALERDANALTLAAAVRCVLVASSLFSKEGSRSRARDRTEPYRLPSVDLATSSGAEQERLVALSTLAHAVQDEAIAAAIRQASLDLGPVGEVSPRAVPAIVKKPANAVDTARLRAASPSELGRLLSARTPPSLAGHRREEIIACAEQTEDVYRVTAFAAAVAYAADEDRESLVQKAMDAYAEFGDDDCQRAVLALGPWMAEQEAVSLFCTLVAGDWGTTLPERLTGWAGVTDLIPLLHRLGGDEALHDVASEIIKVGQWLP